MQLFTEIFPIDTPPTLSAYHLRLYELPPNFPSVDTVRLGRVLVTKLRKALPGGWLFQDGRILTDTEALIFDITAILQQFREDDPNFIGLIEAFEPDFTWMPTPEIIADFVIRTKLNALEAKFNTALAKFSQEVVKNIRVERDYKATPWNVNGTPAVSLAIVARLVHTQNAQGFADEQGNAKLVGLRVSDQTVSGEIIKVTGTVAERREKMLKSTKKEAQRRIIGSADANDLAVRVRVGEKRLELPASALELLVRPSDFALFGIDERIVAPGLRPDPVTRSMYIKTLSDITKESGILGRAFSVREYPALFKMPDFEPYLRFSNNRSRPYNLAKLPLDFIQCGAFHLRDAFTETPIRVGVVNALTMKIEDFVEALQRQLTRTFDFKIEVIRERKVRVASLKNLESAVRVLEEEQPDIILAFIPDETEEGEDLPAFVKSLTLGKGIPGHVLFQSTLDDPEAMPGIIMAILARTGNTPFALADPLEFADFVVGLDFVFDSRANKAVTTVTAIARIYRSNGEFVRYAVRKVELADGTLPYVLMRDLFPQRDFAGKRVVIHHDGRFSQDAKQALSVWGQAIKAVFCLVEIVRRGAPRLYSFAENRVQAPPWGSTFRLNDFEGFVVLNLDDEEAVAPVAKGSKPSATPQPLHIIATGITLDQAVRSLQLWTLLYYGMSEATRLPVTIYGAGDLGYWLRKGGTISAPEGEVPFWL